MLSGIIKTNKEVVLETLVINIDEDVMNDIMATLKSASTNTGAPVRLKLAECECNRKAAHMEITTCPEIGTCSLRISGESLWDVTEQKYIAFEREYITGELLDIFSKFEQIVEIDGIFLSTHATAVESATCDNSEVMIAVHGIGDVDSIFLSRDDILSTAVEVDTVLNTDDEESTIHIKCILNREGSNDEEKGFIYVEAKSDKTWIEIHGNGPVSETIKNLHISTEKFNDVLKDIIVKTKR